MCILPSSSVHRNYSFIGRSKMVDVVSPHTMPSESEVLVARCFLAKILQSSMRYNDVASAPWSCSTQGRRMCSPLFCFTSFCMYLIPCVSCLPLKCAKQIFWFFNKRKASWFCFVLFLFFCNVPTRKNDFKGKNDPSSRPHSWHSSKLTVEESESLGKETTTELVWQQRETRLKDSSCQTDHHKQHLLTGQLGSMSSMEKMERPAPPFSSDHASPTKYTSINEPLSGSGSRRDTFSSFVIGTNPLVLDSSSLGRKGTSAESIFFKDKGPFTVGHPENQQTPCKEGSRLDERNSSWMPSKFRPSIGTVWQVPEKKKSKDGCVLPYCERFEKNPKIYSSSVERLHEGNKFKPGTNIKSRYSITSLADKDFFHPSRTGEHNQLQTNNHFSLSSTDIRQSPFANRPPHHKQDSDESLFYPQTCLAPRTKTQSVGSYYRSLQDLPGKVSSRKLIWCSSASMPATSLENNGQSVSVIKKGKQMGHTENKGHIGLLKNVPLRNPQIAERSHCRGPQDATKRSEGHINNMKRIFPAHQNDNDKASLSRLHNPWVPQEDHQISPLEAPLLHSLAQESRIQTEATPTSIVSSQNLCASVVANGGEARRRGDRYATTLRNEVQQKRAQLQKSCSSATLTCDVHDEDPAQWEYAEPPLSWSISSSNTYKDNLKEAQARVLQATSFQRRDLEPLGTEAPVLKTSNGRIRGRKRFLLAKRMHSFSEPDKIDRVGVDKTHPDGNFVQIKFSGAKPAFSKPVRPGTTSNTELHPSQERTVETKERRVSGEAREIHPSVETSCLSPLGEVILQEQQKLGTFADYQATWNKQKRTSEAKVQGRYYSAENILDTEAEEKAACFHERTRSSPSADFCTQNRPSMLRDPKVKQSNSGARNGAPVPDISDHQPSQYAVIPTFAVCSKPGSLNSILGSQQTAQPPQANAISPSRLHLDLETTCLSQDLLSVVRADSVKLQSLSSLDTTTKSPAPPGSPRRCKMSQSEGNTEDAESNKEPYLSSAYLSLAAANHLHAPSPHFPLLRLMDKQPFMSVQEDSHFWSENDSQPSEAVVDLKGSGGKILGVVPTFSPQSNNTSGVLKTCSDIIPVDAKETWPSSTFSVCIQQPTQDLGNESERLVPKDRIPKSKLAREEDAKTEQLVRDIMGKDKSLVEILDQTGMKTTMDLMEGLFLQEKQVLEGSQQRRRTSCGPRLPTTSRRDEENVSTAVSLVPTSCYYNTSAPKAELLIKMKDMQEQLLEQDSEEELDENLASKKQELISSLAQKLEVLREARQSLQEDVEDNEALGSEVETTVKRYCLPNQLDKFRMFVGDLDKVVSLLLSLSGRLARVENALNSLEDGAPPEEKCTLTEKRKLLMRQHEDAKELKENLDRRERLVSSIMETHLDPERLDDYRHFVKMKSALIIEQRKLEDKIKLGEEQLKCLLDSLPLEQRSQF
ncbi:protein Shroom2-like isoform X3 [Hippocampus zosterae]|uniref:protein Shroom2-like isoform X3 n=1 Tax=Hippocampus zosterae TaxID=109293 RepID=UPI00223CE5E4|nr:protein Shroom2-like isoform X3 [Hippocampus zosterae]